MRAALYIIKPLNQLLDRFQIQHGPMALFAGNGILFAMCEIALLLSIGNPTARRFNFR